MILLSATSTTTDFLQEQRRSHQPCPVGIGEATRCGTLRQIGEMCFPPTPSRIFGLHHFWGRYIHGPKEDSNNH